MTNGNEDDKGKVLDYDHLVFRVANAKTASSYFTTRLGFEMLAIREATLQHPILSYVVQLNMVTIVFESPTTAEDTPISKDLAAHGDFVKDIAFKVEDLDELVARAKEGGAEILKPITEEKDNEGSLRYAVLKTYGNNTHTLIDRRNYQGVFLPGFKKVDGDDNLNKILPKIEILYIDHVEANLTDGTLKDCVSWYNKNLNMKRSFMSQNCPYNNQHYMVVPIARGTLCTRFWCVDYKQDLVPYSCINSDSVINGDETVLLSMNEAAKGLRPTSKASDFVKALGTSGVEHVALNTDDIVATMKSLRSRGAEVISWPATYYDIIREKLKTSPVTVAESIDTLQEFNILIDFDDRGYMLQAFTKHLQARPTLFIEVLQRRNHRGFGAMNYKWVFEAIERLEEAVEKDKLSKK